MAAVRIWRRTCARRPPRAIERTTPAPPFCSRTPSYALLPPFYLFSESIWFNYNSLFVSITTCGLLLLLLLFIFIINIIPVIIISVVLNVVCVADTGVRQALWGRAEARVPLGVEARWETLQQHAQIPSELAVAWRANQWQEDTARCAWHTRCRIDRWRMLFASLAFLQVKYTLVFLLSCTKLCVCFLFLLLRLSFVHMLELVKLCG